MGASLFRRLAASLVLVGGLSACARADATNADFSHAQRAQIVEIIRESLHKDPTILRDAIVTLQADNARIEAQASKAAIASQQHALYTAVDPVLGNPKAPIAIVEFYDVRCPYCKRLEPALEDFVAKDRSVRVVRKDLPILGAPSRLGAQALLAAQQQGGYDRLRAQLMGGSEDITVASIEQAVKRAGLDWPRLERDMQSPSVQTQLAANGKLGQALNVQGTPTLIIGQQTLEGPSVAEIADAVAAAEHGRRVAAAAPGKISHQ